jgi:hypothetical protein
MSSCEISILKYCFIVELFEKLFRAMSCIFYLTLPRVRDLFLHWQRPKNRFCWHWAGGGGRGTEGIAYAVLQGRHSHWPRRSHDQKGQLSLALGSWRWGGGYGGREGWGLGMKGRGVAYFLPQTCADIYHTGVFQKYAFCS